MARISEEEYEILNFLNNTKNWIVRDSDGTLWSYDEKPMKYYGRNNWDFIKCGDNGRSQVITTDLFQFIQWSDSEPHSIAELIEHYEYWQRLAKNPTIANLVGYKESEGTEVKKDKKWFVDKWTKERNKTDVHDPMYHFINEFIADVDQLDEPETLSQEWIDKKRLIERVENYIPLHDKTVGDVVSGILEIIKQLPELEVLSPDWIDENQHPYGGDYHVPSEKLEEILVPKQEELTDEQIARKVDQAYKDGYEKGKEHATENEKETVASVFVNFLIASAKLKLELGMEVEELEE